MLSKLPLGWLAFWLPLLVALTPWQAHGDEVQGPQVTAEVQEPAKSPAQAVVLQPFYFFREKESGVWVERILVHLEADGDQTALDANVPQNRALLQEILESAADAGHLREKALAGLRKNLGFQAVRGLQVSRSTLILR